MPVKATTKKATVKKPATKRATTKKASSKDLFSDYIDRIKQARLNSQELIEPYIEEGKPALVVNLIWEAIFDYFCRVDKEDISPTNLNTLAGVVQKLLATSKEASPKASNASISPQTLADIEDKLNLL